jgi:hypothetical protein
MNKGLIYSGACACSIVIALFVTFSALRPTGTTINRPPATSSVDSECVRKAAIRLSATRDDYLSMAKIVCEAGEQVSRETGGWRPW